MFEFDDLSETFADRLLREVDISSRQFRDAEIICSDSCEPYKVNVLTLAALSPMLREALESVFLDEYTAVLVVDGVSKHGVALFFEALFRPSTTLTDISDSDLVELQTVTQLFCMPLDLEIFHTFGEFNRDRNKADKTDKDFVCAICDSAFATVKLLKRHERTVHAENHPHCCLVCGRRCRGPAELLIHVRVHSREKPFSCVCGKSFAQKSNLTDHTLKVHSAKSNGYFACHVCGKNCKSQAHFKHHFSTNHKSLQKVQRIDYQESETKVCEEDFETIENIELDTIDEIFACDEHEPARIPHDDLGDEQANSNGIICKLCGKSFTQTSHLNVHVKNSHEGLKPHMCSICGKQFGLKSNLKKHLRMHERKISEEIEDRGIDLSTPPPVIEGLSESADKFLSPEKIFQGSYNLICKFCGKGFSQETELLNHMKIHAKKPYFCSICKTNFDSWTSLKIHEADHTGGETFACDLCHLACVSKSALDKHLLTHTGEKPHECSVLGCGRRFVQKSQLNYHIKIVHGPPVGSRPKVYHCLICRRSFTTNSALRKHERIHSNDRPHHCHICSKTFLQKAHLINHLSHHTGSRPFACSDCPKSFTTQFNLNQHLKTHLGSKSLYQCSQPGCFAKYARAFDLRVHERKHTGETPFQCLSCARAFRSQRLLKEHSKSHLDLIPLICKNCSKTFSTASGLRQHYRRHDTCRLSTTSFNIPSEAFNLQEEKFMLADNETELLVESLLVP